MSTLPIVTKAFMNHCLFEKNLSSKTIKAYRIDLRQLLEFLVKKEFSIEIITITKIELREYLESISMLKPKSIKRKIATIKALFNFLEFEDIVPMNPLRKMRIRIREPRLLPKTLNLTQVGSVFKSLYSISKEHMEEKSYKYFESIRNIVVIELLFATGARVSEIANLRDEQIDVNSGDITIKGKGDKERIIQICNQETIEILRKYRRVWLNKITESGGYFLVNRLNCKLSDQSIRTIVKLICKKACIPTNVTPHAFRHTVATLLLEREVDIKYIQAILGHSSIVTTQIYTHVNREKQKQILRNKHPRKEFSTA
jgi:integrase/recombinase XerD